MPIPSPDVNYSTLTQIITKVRLLTRSPSTNQLSDQQITDYINNFVLYDFPQHLRLFSLRKTLTFYTRPNIDVYGNNLVNATDPLYNFNNIYTSIHGPIYVAGVNAFFSESREQFWAIYPNIRSIRQIATGDGVTTNFAGTLTDIPCVLNQVLIESIDANNNGISLIDKPNTDPISGYTLTTGILVQQNFPAVNCGTINYVTGAYVLNFPATAIPGLGQAINSQVIAYQAAKPQAIIFYDDNFIVRPVPDKPYPISMEAYIRPSVLLAGTDGPKLAQWWQYIAYGATKKVFEDRMDMDSIQMIMPEYKKQETLVLRQTIMEMSNERVATIYTEQTSMGTLAGGASNWGGF